MQWAPFGIVEAVDVSLFLAKVWGLYLVIIPAVFLVKRKAVQSMVRLLEDEKFVFMSAFLALLVGILSVSAFTMWVYDWRGLITLLGWLAIAKGIVRFVWPEGARKIAQYFVNNARLFAIVLVVNFLLGVYLISVGF